MAAVGKGIVYGKLVRFELKWVEVFGQGRVAQGIGC
jgi:hypothetical protein